MNLSFNNDLFHTNNDPHMVYHASGMGGQVIFVVPKYNLIAAFTGWLSGAYDYFYRDLIEDYILQFSTGNCRAILGIPLITLLLTTGIAVVLYRSIVKRKIIRKSRRRYWICNGYRTFKMGWKAYWFR